jgi:hypothetical protein
MNLCWKLDFKYLDKIIENIINKRCYFITSFYLGDWVELWVHRDKGKIFLFLSSLKIPKPQWR